MLIKNQIRNIQMLRSIQISEVVDRRCSVKKVYLKILQSSASVLVSSLIKLPAVSASFLKKTLVFPVNYAKFLRTTFLQINPRTAYEFFLSS